MKWRMKLLAAYVLATVSLLGLFSVDAQEQKLGAGTAPVTATPAPNPLPGAKKSYPLPEPLAEQIDKLVRNRNAAERAFLNYVSDPKIYSSEDDVIRVAMFDRQQKLFKQFGAALDEAGKWVVAQRKEFKCDNCEAQLVDGKWLFKEPDVATTAQGGAK